MSRCAVVGGLFYTDCLVCQLLSRLFVCVSAIDYLCVAVYSCACVIINLCSCVRVSWCVVCGQAVIVVCDLLCGLSCVMSLCGTFYACDSALDRAEPYLSCFSYL